MRAATDVMTKIVRHGGLAPALWATEVAEGLRKAVARGRQNAAEAQDTGWRISLLGVSQDNETWEKAWKAILPLAMENNLSAYDAAYLELAIRKSLPLATLDTRLRTAARKRNVFVLPQV